MEKTIQEKAKEYQPKQIKTVAELPYITTDMVVYHKEDSDFPFDYVLVEGEEYKLPLSVLSSIKEIQESNPSLSKFKVRRSGEGIKTKYTVVPLIQEEPVRKEEPQ